MAPAVLEVVARDLDPLEEELSRGVELELPEPHAPSSSGRSRLQAAPHPLEEELSVSEEHLEGDPSARVHRLGGLEDEVALVELPSQEGDGLAVVVARGPNGEVVSHTIIW